MKKNRIFSRIFSGLALLFSHAMCAAIAYRYAVIKWGMECRAYSAPASTAFLLAIPFGAGILICAALAWFFHRASLRP